MKVVVRKSTQHLSKHGGRNNGTLNPNTHNAKTLGTMLLECMVCRLGLVSRNLTSSSDFKNPGHYGFLAWALGVLRLSVQAARTLAWRF